MTNLRLIHASLALSQAPEPYAYDMPVMYATEDLENWSDDYMPGGSTLAVNRVPEYHTLPNSLFNDKLKSYISAQPLI